MENLEKDMPVVATEHIAPENHIKCDLEELREKIRLLLKRGVEKPTSTTINNIK